MPETVVPEATMPGKAAAVPAAPESAAMSTARGGRVHAQSEGPYGCAEDESKSCDLSVHLWSPFIFQDERSLPTLMKVWWTVSR
jgi:hypothetical protein